MKTEVATTGRDKYVGEWKEDYRDREGVYYWEDGNNYNGSWKDNLGNGNGTKYYADKGIFLAPGNLVERTDRGFNWAVRSQQDKMWVAGIVISQDCFLGLIENGYSDSLQQSW